MFADLAALCNGDFLMLRVSKFSGAQSLWFFDGLVLSATKCHGRMAEWQLIISSMLVVDQLLLCWYLVFNFHVGMPIRRPSGSRAVLLACFVASDCAP
jgi:hypothetical protein